MMTLLFKAREEKEANEQAQNEAEKAASSSSFLLSHRHGTPTKAIYKLSQIKTVFGVSGPYDLVGLTKHFHNKGLHMPMLAAIMGGREFLGVLSPTRLVLEDQIYRDPELIKLFPPVIPLHGTADECVPHQIAIDFAKALFNAGYNAQVKLYEGKTHTDPIIEDLLYAEEVLH